MKNYIFIASGNTNTFIKERLLVRQVISLTIHEKHAVETNELKEEKEKKKICIENKNTFLVYDWTLYEIVATQVAYSAKINKKL